MIQLFSEITLKDIGKCWWKWASLGEMTQAGFRVPAGFVLTSEAYGKKRMVWEISVLNAFDSLGCKFVAVRSSGTKEDGIEDSFAGQFETYLYVTREQLIEKIIECHDSLNSPRIIAYCHSKNIDRGQIKVAVVIQKMINSDVAGVGFTVNPITYNTDEVMLEAWLGIGEAVVSGMITPDNYIINKKTDLIEKIISIQNLKITLNAENGGTKEEKIEDILTWKQKLSDEHILEISKLAKKIELHYGKPMDIEWGVEWWEVFILQARPMTTLGKYKEKYHFMWWQKQSAMVAEAMILNFVLYNDEFTITEKINNVIREHAEWFSYIYFSHSSLNNWYINGNIYLTKEWRIFMFDMIEEVQKNFQAIIKEIQEVQYGRLSQEQKWELFRKYMKCIIFIQKLFRASDPSSTQIIEKILLKHIEEKFGSESSVKIMADLITSCKLDKTQEEVIDFYDLISDKSEIQDSELHTHWLRYPWNFANVWSKNEARSYLRERMNKTDIPDLKKEIENIYKSKQELHEKQQIILSQIAPEYLDYVQTLQHLWITRFHLKHCWSGAETLISDFLQNLANEVGMDYENFMMSYNFSDILTYLESGKRLPEEEIQKRLFYSIVHFHDWKIEYIYWEDAKKYFDNLYTLESTGHELQWMCANGGSISGKVRIVVVDDLKQFQKDCETFEAGEILVTTMTSPLMIELAKKSAGIITNEWGICSHAAIIARELWIPCVVGTRTATKKLKTWDMVSMQADSWSINIL